MSISESQLAAFDRIVQETPTDVRSDWGKDRLEKARAGLEAQMATANDSTDKLVDALAHAVSTLPAPDYYYEVYSLPERLMFTLIDYFPEQFQDYFLLGPVSSLMGLFKNSTTSAK